MSEKVKAVLLVIAICVAVEATTIGILNLVYPNTAIEISTEGMSEEQIELLELWMGF